MGVFYQVLTYRTLRTWDGMQSLYYYGIYYSLLGSKKTCLETEVFFLILNLFLVVGCFSTINRDSEENTWLWKKERKKSSVELVTWDPWAFWTASESCWCPSEGLNLWLKLWPPVSKETQEWKNRVWRAHFCYSQKSDCWQRVSSRPLCPKASLETTWRKGKQKGVKQTISWVALYSSWMKLVQRSNFMHQRKYCQEK